MDKDKIVMYNMLKKDEYLNTLIEMQSKGFDINKENNKGIKVDTKGKTKKLTKCYTRGRLNK